MQTNVAAFVSRYFARQANGGGTTSATPIEFLHKVAVGVNDSLRQRSFPIETINQLKRRIKKNLNEIDPKDAGVRSFRVNDALQQLSAFRVPNSALSLLRVLIETMDDDPLLVDEGLSSSGGPPPSQPRRSTTTPMIANADDDDDASGESDAPITRQRRGSAAVDSASSRQHRHRSNEADHRTSSRPRPRRRSSFALDPPMRDESRPSTSAAVMAAAPSLGVLAQRPSAPPQKDPYWGEIPQAVILRDLLYPLQGINGQFIKWHVPTKAFLLRRDVFVSGPVRHLVARIAAMGGYYRRIREIVDSHLLPTPDHPQIQKAWWNANDTEPTVTVMPSTGTADVQGSSHPVVTFPSTAVEESPREPRFRAGVQMHRQLEEVQRIEPVKGLAQAAWTQFVRDLLAQYYQALSEVEARLMQIIDSLGPDFPTRTVDISTGSTLRQLIVTFDDVCERLAILAETTEAVNQLKGAPLLEFLYGAAWRGDELGRSILTTAITGYVLPVWERQLTKWLTNGSVEDPYKEFFIESNSVAKDAKNLEYLWREHAWVVESRLLPFVDLNLATMCLHAGILQCLLRGAEELQGVQQSETVTTPTRRMSSYALVSASPDESIDDWPDVWDGVAAVLNDAAATVTTCVRMQWGASAAPSKAAVVAGRAAAGDAVELPVSDLATAQPVMESLRDRIEGIVRQRSAILVNELVVRHQIIQQLDFIRRVCLLQQNTFADALAELAVTGDLKMNIDELTNHQLGRMLNAAVSGSSVNRTPASVLQRLSLNRVGRNVPGFQAVTLRWNSNGTAARLLLTETTEAILGRLQAVAWRLTVAVRVLNGQSWRLLQTFRRRFLPIDLCRKLPSTPTVLESLDEEGYLVTFMCETLQAQLLHVVQILRLHLLQDFATTAWLHFIEDLRDLTGSKRGDTNPTLTAKAASSMMTIRQPSSGFSTNTTKIHLDDLLRTYDDYLASLAVGWYLKENQDVPMPAAAEILNGSAADETRRPILTALLRLCELCSDFGDAVENSYPRLMEFIAQGLGKSVQFDVLSKIQELLTRCATEIARLLTSLDNASRESDLAFVDPLDSERSSLLIALKANLNFQDFFEVGSGMAKLQGVATQLIAERKEQAA